MKCFNCSSDLNQILSEPNCKQCGFRCYCRDFTCHHHNIHFKILKVNNNNMMIDVFHTETVNMVQGAKIINVFKEWYIL